MSVTEKSDMDLRIGRQLEAGRRSESIIDNCILQVLRHDVLINEASERLSLLPDSISSGKMPKEKWLKRRTTIKVKVYRNM